MAEVWAPALQTSVRRFGSSGRPRGGARRGRMERARPRAGAPSGGSPSLGQRGSGFSGAGVPGEAAAACTLGGAPLCGLEQLRAGAQGPAQGGAGVWSLVAPPARRLSLFFQWHLFKFAFGCSWYAADK